MGLFDWLGRITRNEAKQRARVRIPDSRNVTTTGAKGNTAVAEQHYIRIWLSELFLKNDEKWFTRRFPLAYSLIALKYADRGVELANVSGKNKFDIKQPDLGKSILRNYPLTPLLPFRGGTLEVDCGLVSMRAGSILQSFAAVVSDLAGKLNAPQVSAIVGIAEGVASGVQELLGAGEAETMLYVHETFDTSTLRAGYIVLSGKPQIEIDPATIWVTDEGVRQGNSVGSLKVLEPQDYLVLRIDVVDERDDWRSLSAIAEPLDAALAASYEGDEPRAKLLVGQAKIATMKSSDLTSRDKLRIIAGIDKELAAPAFAGGPDEETPLERVVARVSIEEANALGPLDEEEVLRSLQ